jgi:hypothetical protein
VVSITRKEEILDEIRQKMGWTDSEKVLRWFESEGFEQEFAEYVGDFADENPDAQVPDFDDVKAKCDAGGLNPRQNWHNSKYAVEMVDKTGWVHEDHVARS